MLPLHGRSDPWQELPPSTDPGRKPALERPSLPGRRPGVRGGAQRGGAAVRGRPRGRGGGHAARQAVPLAACPGARHPRRAAPQPGATEPALTGATCTQARRTELSSRVTELTSVNSAYGRCDE